MTVRSLAGAQGLVIGIVLVGAALAKLPPAALKELARASALARLAGSARRAAQAWRAIALGELAVGLCVLTLPSEPWPLVAGAALLGGALAYTVVGQVVRPGSPCGCFGSLSVEVPWWQSLIRTGFLLGCCLAALVVGVGWTAVDEPGVWALVAVESVLLIMLSPERHAVRRAAGRWMRRSRWTIVRWRMGVDCANAAGPPARETSGLSTTPLWARVSPYVCADQASEVWRDGCWEFATFPGRYEGAPATVVFGIPLDPFVPTRTVAVVDEGAQSVLHREELQQR
jgi:hypothetical protein